MLSKRRRQAFFVGGICSALTWVSSAFAQGQPPPAQPYPGQQQDPNQQYPQQGPQQYPQQQYPQQQYPQQQYPQQGQQQYPQQQYPQQGQQQYAGAAAGGSVEPPPPPAPPPERPSRIPDFSIRADPLRWLMQGRLGFELEVELWEFITLSSTPIFVTSSTPYSLNSNGTPDSLRQKSNGLGALSGLSLGVGFWLGGKPLKGYVLKAEITNYSYRYRTVEAGQTVDTLNFVERRLLGRFGSYSRYGAFIIGGTIGLGAELNPKKRCYETLRTITTNCAETQILYTEQGGGGAYSVRGTFGSAVIGFDLSLGVAF